jgi:hypothetical protein
LCDIHKESSSARKVKRFWIEFENVTVPQRRFIHRIVNTLTWEKAESKCCVVAEQKWEEIGRRLQHPPEQYLMHCGYENGCKNRHQKAMKTKTN